MNNPAHGVTASQSVCLLVSKQIGGSTMEPTPLSQTCLVAGTRRTGTPKKGLSNAAVGHLYHDTCSLPAWRRRLAVVVAVPWLNVCPRSEFSLSISCCFVSSHT